MELIVSFSFGAFVFIVLTGISMGLRDEAELNGATSVTVWPIPVALIVLLVVVPAVYVWWIGL